jgi:hypothetical protein
MPMFIEDEKERVLRIPCGKNKSLILLTVDEITGIWWMLSGMFSFYGAILYWVGVWGLLTLPLYTASGVVDGDAARALIPVYFFCGFLMALACDSLYSMGLIDGGYFPSEWARTKSWVFPLRVFCGLLSTLLLWIAVFLTVSHSFGGFDTGILATFKDGSHAPHKYMTKDVTVFVAGVVLLIVSGTYYPCGGVYMSSANGWFGTSSLGIGDRLSDQTEDAQGGEGKRGLCCGIPMKIVALHVHELCRAVVSLVGQIMLWQGLWDLEEYHSPSTLWREVCYMALGLVGFIMCDKVPLYLAAVYDQSGRGGVWERTLELSQRSSSVGTAIRAGLSILAQTTHMVGCWTIFDSYLTVPGDTDLNTGRNALYAVTGLLMLTAADKLPENAGVQEGKGTTIWGSVVDVVVPISIGPRKQPASALNSLRQSLLHSITDSDETGDIEGGSGDHSHSNMLGSGYTSGAGTGACHAVIIVQAILVVQTII